MNQLAVSDRDQWLGATASLVVGLALVTALVGTQENDLGIVVAGAVIAAIAFGILLACGWIDPIMVVVLAAPLPALLSTESIRVALAAPITAIAVTGWYLHRAATRSRLEHGLLPFRPLLVLAAVFLFTTLTAQSRGTSVREITNLAILAAFMIAAVDHFMTRPESRQRAASVLVATAACLGGLAVLESLNILPGNYPRWGTQFNRAATGLGHPNSLGLYLAMAVPFAAHFISTGQTCVRWLARGCLGLIVIGTAATFSRGSWLALLGGSLLLLCAGERRYLGRVWIVTVLFALVIEFASGGALTDTARRTVGDWVIEQRAALMLAGVVMYLEHPLVGVGAGGFADYLTQIGGELPQLWDYEQTPHNTIVQIAAETGTIGLLAFIATITIVLRIMLRSARDRELSGDERSFHRAVLWSFGIAVCSFLVIWPFQHGTGQIVMLVAAMGLSLVPNVAQSSGRDS